MTTFVALLLYLTVATAVRMPDDYFAHVGDDDEFRKKFDVDVRIGRFRNQDNPLLFPHIEILPDEGHVPDDVAKLHRHGRGIIFNVAVADPMAVLKEANEDHFDPSFQALHQTVKAVMAAARVKAALRQTGNESLIKTLLYTNFVTWKFLTDKELCHPNAHSQCALFSKFGGETVFDYVRFYEQLTLPAVTQTFPDSFQQWPSLWLARIIAYLHTPFTMTMGFDSDVYVCDGFESLFDNYIDDKHLFAATFDPPFYGIQDRFRAFMRDDFPNSYKFFPERNAGMIVMHTGHPNMLKLLALWRDVYLRHVNNPEYITYVLGDQPALREALFTIRPMILDKVIPMSIGCRYKDQGYGTTDTFHAMCTDTCLTVHRREAFPDHTDASGNFLNSPLSRRKKPVK